jgi:hypothetical protein
VQRFEPGAIGGVAELRFDALGYVRPRTTPGPRGRHAAGHRRRAAFGGFDWRRTEILANGLW